MGWNLNSLLWLNPEKIKTTGNDSSNKDWILIGKNKEVRPYRLLINIS